MTEALGYLEVPYLSVTCRASDAAAKAADVRILGFEPTGIETIVVRLASRNDPDLDAALAAGVARAKGLGVSALAVVLARPETAQSRLNDNPNSINPLYGGRDELRPTDFPEHRTMNTQHALGILETQGLTAILHATDTMLKAANVELVGKEKIGAAYVTIIVRGDVATVNAAIEAGTSAVGDLGKLIAAQVIARPHESLLKPLPG